MELILLRKGFDFPDPDKVVLLDYCRPIIVNDTHIIFYTNLNACGTEVTYSNVSKVYHNEVRKSGLPKHLSVDLDTINRKNVDIKQRRIGFDCHYDSAEDINWSVYAPHVDNIHNDDYGERSGYRITLYHSTWFTDAFLREEYPINVEWKNKFF